MHKIRIEKKRKRKRKKTENKHFHKHQAFFKTIQFYTINFSNVNVIIQAINKQYDKLTFLYYCRFCKNRLLPMDIVKQPQIAITKITSIK